MWSRAPENVIGRARQRGNEGEKQICVDSGGGYLYTYSCLARPGGRAGLNLKNHIITNMAKYAINGFGRIGRNVLRAMSQAELEKVVAIHDLTPIATTAHLLIL